MSLVRGMNGMSLASGRMPTARNDTPMQYFREPPPHLEPTVLPRRQATMSSPFPYGMGNAAVTHSSTSTSMSVYEELPRNHLCSTLNLPMTMSTSMYTDSVEDSDVWDGVDFSGI